MEELLKNALIIAKNKNFDVFNALDILDNDGLLKELKFGIGDGNLHYYFFNWRVPEFKPSQIGIVLVWDFFASHYIHHILNILLQINFIILDR